MSNTELLYLHGWGFKNTVFDELSKGVAVKQKPKAPCLYKVARKSGDSSFESISSHLSKEIKRPTIIVAWSMGGFIALRLANISNHIIKLVLITTAPKMVNTGGWDQTISKNEFDKLQEGFKTDFNQTLNNFLGLVCFGDEKYKTIKRALKKDMAEETDADILSSWLNQLEMEDQSVSFSTNNNPTLVVLGENDVLIKRNVVNQLRELNKNTEYKIIENSGHVPFVSKVNEVQQAINGFINDTNY